MKVLRTYMVVEINTDTILSIFKTWDDNIGKVKRIVYEKYQGEYDILPIDYGAMRKHINEKLLAVLLGELIYRDLH